jgi:hypothetical protein
LEPKGFDAREPAFRRELQDGHRARLFQKPEFPNALKYQIPEFNLLVETGISVFSWRDRRFSFPE